MLAQWRGSADRSQISAWHCSARARAGTSKPEGKSLVIPQAILVSGHVRSASEQDPGIGNPLLFQHLILHSQRPPKAYPVSAGGVRPSSLQGVCLIAIGVTCLCPRPLADILYGSQTKMQELLHI